METARPGAYRARVWRVLPRHADALMRPAPLDTRRDGARVRPLVERRFVEGTPRTRAPDTPTPFRNVARSRRRRRPSVLETLVVVLIILWLLGLVTSTTMGGFIHVLLVIALVVVAIRLLRGRRIA